MLTITERDWSAATNTRQNRLYDKNCYWRQKRTPDLGAIQQEITIINICNIRGPKYTRQKLTELKGQTGNSTIIMEL